MAPYLDPRNDALARRLSESGGPPLYSLSSTDARQFLEDAQKHTPASDVNTEEFSVDCGKFGDVKTMIYKPTRAGSGALPTVFYFHGGGWILGSANTHDRLLRDLVRETGYAFVFPSYTPAPEAKYPTQLEQAYGVVKHVTTNAKSLGLDLAKTAVCGDSVGGHMSIAVAHLVKQRGGPEVKYMALLYPLTDTSKESATFREFEHGPGLEVKTIRWMIDAFLPNKADRLAPLASPLLTDSAQLAAQLPPTLIITADVDPLRDEGEAFGQALQKAGVECAMFRADGEMHDFAMLNALAGSPTTVAAIELVALKLKKALR